MNKQPRIGRWRGIMIYVRLEGHNFRYEIENIIKTFFKDKEIQFIEQPPADHRGIFLFSGIVSRAGEDILSSHIKIGGEFDSIEEPLGELERNNPDIEPIKVLKKGLQRQLYILLQKNTGIEQPWGMLIGIRPAKIVHEMLEKGCDKNHIIKKLNSYYMISKEKAELLYNVAETEKYILSRTASNSISIYIGVPFCPSRCLYCSFTSNPIGKYRKLVSSYIAALKHEIKGSCKLLSQRGYKIQSIYFGGGTPTSIDHEALEDLLHFIEEEFDLEDISEYTLEAGRPDSIDRRKLEIIRKSRVNRISINPQTMNDETLKLIGRNHTAEDITRAFALAREIGFNNINMDLIIGLPGEDSKMFEKTLEAIYELSPESLTVHAMAVKRASRLKEEKFQYTQADNSEASNMIDMSQRYAERMKMHPYYLYRQKNMLGNLENVGYCKSGCESIYNVQIMEEKQTIIAFGAGAITKVVFGDENRLERAFNVKGVEEYIERIDEMIERKKNLLYS